MFVKTFVGAALAGVAFSAPAKPQNCSESTVPHSNQCLSNWFLEAGCTSRYAVEPNNGWRNESDIATIQEEMADLYAKATAKNAKANDVRKCKPLSKEEMQAQKCFNSIGDDCPSCFVGPFNAIVNNTCVADCVTSSDTLQELCPNLTSQIKCQTTLEDLCGNCTVTGFLGNQFLDGDCFDTCYKKNKNAIRKACPLPEWLEDLMDCEKKLNSTCSKCLSADSEAQCTLECWKDNEAKLNKTCPQYVGNVLAFSANLDKFVQNFFGNLVGNNQGDLDESGDVFGMGAEQPGDFLESLFGGQQPQATQQLQGTDMPDMSNMPDMPDSEDIQNMINGLLGSLGSLLSQLGMGGQQTGLPGTVENPLTLVFGPKPTEIPGVESPGLGIVVTVDSTTFDIEAPTAIDFETPAGTDVEATTEAATGTDVEAATGTDVEAATGTDVEAATGTDVEAATGTDVEATTATENATTTETDVEAPATTETPPKTTTTKATKTATKTTTVKASKTSTTASPTV